jgi:hypothetical protein
VSWFLLVGPQMCKRHPYEPKNPWMISPLLDPFPFTFQEICPQLDILGPTAPFSSYRPIQRENQGMHIPIQLRRQVKVDVLREFHYWFKNFFLLIILFGSCKSFLSEPTFTSSFPFFQAIWERIFHGPWLC